MFFCKTETLSTWFTEAPRTVVATAFALELEAILSNVEVVEQYTLGTTEVYRVVVDRKEFAVVLVGVGVRKAKKSSKKLFQVISIKELIFVGIAGAVHPSLRVGDVVVVKTWKAYYEAGLMSVDEVLLRKVQEIKNVRVFETGITTKKFIETKTELTGHGDIVDMESFEIVSKANSEHVPVLVLKGISDPSNHGGTDDSFSLAAMRCAEALFLFLALER